MKGIILLFMLLLVIQTEARKECLTQDECDLETECCMTLRLLHYRTGYCRSKPKEGEKCDPRNYKDISNYDLYSIRCPCYEGYECIPDSVTIDKQLPTFNNAICRRSEE
ncbi:U8-theraphotoxin-Hhn1c 2-like [Centruroides vittatus]|uniref:U8-theraphotoxin-Hhn1c 2-like n=1 Tax=Centruroides vittatus TaxID=120091 RepID=UPI0035104DF9